MVEKKCSGNKKGTWNLCLGRANEKDVVIFV